MNPYAETTTPQPPSCRDHCGSCNACDFSKKNIRFDLSEGLDQVDPTIKKIFENRDPNRKDGPFIVKYGDSVFFGRKEGTKITGTLTSPIEQSPKEEANEKRSDKEITPSLEIHTHPHDEPIAPTHESRAHIPSPQDPPITTEPHLHAPTRNHVIETKSPQLSFEKKTTTMEQTVGESHIVEEPSIAISHPEVIFEKPMPAGEETTHHEPSQIIENVTSVTKKSLPENPKSALSLSQEEKLENTSITFEPTAHIEIAQTIAQTHAKAREAIFDVIAKIQDAITEPSEKASYMQEASLSPTPHESTPITLVLNHEPKQFVEQLLTGAQAKLIDEHTDNKKGTSEDQKKYIMSEQDTQWIITVSKDEHGTTRITATPEAFKLFKKRLERFLKTPTTLEEKQDETAEEEKYVSPTPPALQNTDDTTAWYHLWLLLSLVYNIHTESNNSQTSIPVFVYS